MLIDWHYAYQAEQLSQSCGDFLRRSNQLVYLENIRKIEGVL